MCVYMCRNILLKIVVLLSIRMLSSCRLKSHNMTANPITCCEGASANLPTHFARSSTFTLSTPPHRTPTHIITRVGQNHVCTVYIRYIFAGKSPNIQSYTVYRYGSGQPKSSLMLCPIATSSDYSQVRARYALIQFSNPRTGLQHHHNGPLYMLCE
jgi:hypothetical protein